MKRLPRPKGWWNRQAVLLVFALMFTGGLGAFFTVKTVGGLERTHWMAATITAAAAIGLLVCAVAVTLTLTGGGTLRASFGSAGTTFLPPPVAKWSAVFAVCFIVGPVLYMVYGSHVTDDLPAPVPKDYVRMSLIAVACVVLLVVIIRRSLSGNRPMLTISAEGIEYDDLMTRFTIDWDDIADITGHLPKGRRFRPVVFERKSGPPSNDQNLWMSLGRAA